MSQESAFFEVSKLCVLVLNSPSLSLIHQLMKKLLLAILLGFIGVACNPKKTESVKDLDSLNSELALTPAPSILASSPLPGYSVKNAMDLTDSVNFILLTNTEELNKDFLPEKNSGIEIGQPDFVINYIIGVVCMQTDLATTISIDKVEVAGEEINVFVNIKRGAKQKIATKPTQIFSIEKRNDIAAIQFYVNGKKDKSFFMTGL